MTLFYGVVDFRRGLSEVVLEPVTNTMSSYPLAAAHTFTDGTAALAYQLPRYTAAMAPARPTPQQSKPGSFILADAHLDNQADLCSALNVPREAANSLPDSGLILLAYERWGEQTPQHLLGDFAFALWDARSRTLFCARDHIGTRPFYYYQSAGRLYFANNLEALHAFDEVPKELDLRFVRARFETAHYLHPEHSYFEEVKKLPFAHSMTLKESDLRLERHWRPEGIPRLTLLSEDAYAERLAELLGEAVRCRLVSSYPVGTHISGGLDSSAITALAAQHQSGAQALNAFTWSPPPGPGDTQLADERADIELLTSARGVRLHYTPITADSFLVDATQDVTRHPQHTVLVERRTSCIAKEVGVRTLLSGWGGDEAVTFNGRGYIAALFRQLRWRDMRRELRAHGGKAHWLKKTVALGVMPNLPGYHRDGLSRILGRNRQPPIYNRTLPVELHPDFAARLRGVTAYSNPVPFEVPGVHRMQLRLINYGHLSERMESWHAHGMRLGLGYRYPLTDKRLLEFALAIPNDLYFRNGWRRYVFRKAVENVLPKEISWKRQKRDPALFDSYNPSHRRMLESRSLQAAIEERRHQLERQRLVDVDKLVARLDRAIQEEDFVRRFLSIERVSWLAFVGDDVKT